MSLDTATEMFFLLLIGTAIFFGFWYEDALNEWAVDFGRTIRKILRNIAREWRKAK